MEPGLDEFEKWCAINWWKTTHLTPNACVRLAWDYQQEKFKKLIEHFSEKIPPEFEKDFQEHFWEILA